MFHLTLKLKLLEKSKCKSTAFCNLYVTDSALFSSDLFSWHFSEKKKKKSRMGSKKFSGESDFPSNLNWFSDSRLQNVHINLTYADLFLSKHPLTISQVNDLFTTNDR